MAASKVQVFRTNGNEDPALLATFAADAAGRKAAGEYKALQDGAAGRPPEYRITIVEA